MSTSAPITADQGAQLLLVDQVAERLHLSRASVYRKIAARVIPAVRLGPGNAALRVPADDLEQWLHANRR